MRPISANFQFRFAPLALPPNAGSAGLGFLFLFAGLATGAAASPMNPVAPMPPVASTSPAAAPRSAPATAPTPVRAPAPAKVVTWEEEIAAWKSHRIERLQQPDGWLTLVGLAWLKDGENSVGSDGKSTVVLPAAKAPAQLGTIHVAEGKATFVAEKGVSVQTALAPGAKGAALDQAAADASVGTLELVDDASGDPTVLTHGSLSFFVIHRADRLGVRVKDSEAAALKAFHGLDYFPLDRKWRLEGRFEPAAEVKEIPIPNALGFDEPIKSPGHVTFTVAGKEMRLLALDDTGDGRLFLVFGDLTNGHETYGGGRFLYTDPPVDGKVVIDFNRSYNPPCVFTAYATCPLPPRENRLPLRVEVGEKRFAGHDPQP